MYHRKGRKFRGVFNFAFFVGAGTKIQASIKISALSDHQVTSRAYREKRIRPWLHVYCTTSSQIILPKTLKALCSCSYTMLLTILEGGSKRFFLLFRPRNSHLKWRLQLETQNRPISEKSHNTYLIIILH